MAPGSGPASAQPHDLVVQRLNRGYETGAVGLRFLQCVACLAKLDGAPRYPGVEFGIVAGERVDLAELAKKESPRD